MKVIPGIGALADLAGTELGASAWRTIDQPMIDAFAAATDDDQWIHTDPQRASEGPFGTTVAHGLLTLSLLPAMATEIFRVDGVTNRINYGYDRVRFTNPVRVNARIRDRITVQSVTPITGGARVNMEHILEIEGQERPACIAIAVSHLIGASA